ncbi:MAG TPA: DUF1003 domain-containing protein [Pyrinomonadaceae bacterium]|jgi:uncharacterized membrane protein
MNQHLQLAARRFLRTEWDKLTEVERRVVQRLVERAHVSRNTNREFDDDRTLGQRLADRIAAFGGSWTFIIIFGCVLAAWVALNSYVLARRGAAFDPYPYILLNLFLSMLAALQAPVIMMSQNRQAAKDRLDAAHDYEVNLKAELEICALHDKLDELREHRWAELVAMQQEQIRLLQQLLAARAEN